MDYSHKDFKGGMDITEYLVKEKGISLIPLEPFYQKFTPKLIRICFAKENATLEEGLKKLNGFKITCRQCLDRIKLCIR